MMACRFLARLLAPINRAADRYTRDQVDAALKPDPPIAERIATIYGLATAGRRLLTGSWRTPGLTNGQCDLLAEAYEAFAVAESALSRALKSPAGDQS